MELVISPIVRMGPSVFMGVVMLLDPGRFSVNSLIESIKLGFKAVDPLLGSWIRLL